MDVVSARKAFASLIAAAVLAAALPLPSLVAAASAAPTVVTPADEVFPQFGVTPSHSFSPNVSGRGYNDTLVKWKLPLSVSSGATVIANFSSVVALNNTTSRPDVLGVVLGHPGPVLGTSLVTIVAGNNATTMWSYALLGNLFATPIAADVNIDGKMDLVIRSDSGLLEAVTPNITWDGSNFFFPVTNLTEVQAQQLWNRSLIGSGSTNNNLSTPIAVDIVGSAAPEILAPAGDRLYYLSGVDGSEIRNETVDGTIVSAPTAFRVGGAWRILVASTNRTTANFTTVSSDFIVTAFDASLNFLWNMSLPQSYSTAPAYKSLDLQLPSPAAGNLDGAGPGDDWALVTPYENSLSQLRIFYNGTNSFSVNVSLQGLTGSAPAVTDLDGDGKDEVVALSYEPGTPILSPNSRAFVQVFEGNGSLRWSATIDELPGAPRENTLAPPALADFNGDGVKDVVVFLTDGASEVRSGTNGSRILRHQVFDQASPTEFTGPAVADLDKDGFLDITANAAVVSFALAELHLNASDLAVNNTVPEEFQNVSVTATVHNSGNANARNVTVEFSDGALLLNATTLPVIVAGTSAQAQVVVNFSVGGVRTITVEVDGNGTVEELDETNNTASITVNVTSLFGFHFQSPLNRTVVQPGFSYAFIVNVISDGTQTNTVDLTLGSLPAGWAATLNPPSVSISPAGTPEDTNTSFVSVTTDALAVPGEYDIDVGGVSVNSPRNTANITLTVIIGGEFGASLFPSSAADNVTAGDQVAYRFEIINSGNANDTFQLSASTPPPGWQAFPNRPSITLAPGLNATVFLFVGAPPNATAGENASVTLTARSAGNATKNDTATAFTTVVVPDLVVVDIQFFRECGGEVTSGVPRLVQEDDSLIVVTVANAAANAGISSAVVRAWIDGVATTKTTAIAEAGTGSVSFTHRYTSPGVKVVTAEVDPGNFISEVSEANNDLTEQATVKDPNPVGDLTVTGFILKGGLPVPGASVWVTDPRSGANVSTSSSSSGQYAVVLTAAQYLDGDALEVHAADGLDVGNNSAPLCAYSEDAQLTVDVSLGLPSPYDFLLVAAGPTQLAVMPGAAATFEVNVTNRGSLNNTILLSAAGPWAIRILDAGGAPTSVVLLPPNGTVLVRVEVTAPLDGAPGDMATTALNATAASDPARARSISLEATVGVLHDLGLSQDASSATALAGTNVTVNLTVENRGNGNENVTLAAACSGPSPCNSWVTFEFVSFGIPAHSSSTVVATVRVSPAAVAGAYTVNFTAAAANNSSVQANTTFALTGLEVRYDFSVTGASLLRIVPGETRTTNLTVLNRGTVPDSYTVSTSPAGSGYTINLLPGGGTSATVTIDAGGSATVTLEVGAPIEVDRESFDIDVLVESVARGTQRLVSISAEIGTVYDFRITGPTLSADPEVGKEIQILATVANVGLRSFVGSLPVRLTVAGEVIATQTIANLATGREDTVAFRWTARVAGQLNLSVDVNQVAGSDIYESSFANNVMSRTVTVSPAQAPNILSNTSFLLAIVAIVVVLLLAAASVRRKEDVKTTADHEKAAEESDERRMGKGPGGLERL